METILQRNKRIVKEKQAGATLKAMAETYGLNVCNVSFIYHANEHIVDRPIYDLVAGMEGLSDQVAVKLVNALCQYEAMKQVDIDAEYLKAMDRTELIKQRGVGKAIMDAFDKLQEAVRDGCL